MVGTSARHGSLQYSSPQRCVQGITSTGGTVPKLPECNRVEKCAIGAFQPPNKNLAGGVEGGGGARKEEWTADGVK